MRKISRDRLKKTRDRVNYAVFEREDRVKDLTTVKRMTGCIGMYLAATATATDLY